MKSDNSKQGQMDGRKNNGQERCRAEDGRFESCGDSSSKSSKSSSQNKSGNGSNERCRDENGRFESCDK